MRIVEKTFVDQMIKSCEYIFDRDEDERDVYVTYSATMRGVFTKWNRKIPLLGRDGKLYWVLPGSGGKIVPVDKQKFERSLPKFDGDK